MRFTTYDAVGNSLLHKAVSARNSELTISLRRLERLALVFALGLSVTLFPASSCLGVTLLSGPTFARATNAPLAGVLRLTTDVEARISVTVNDGTSSWTRNFHEFSRTHALPLLGFKPNRTNQIAVTVSDKAQHSYSAPEVLTFVTTPLPADFPRPTVLKSQPAKMEPGFTLFIVQNRTARISYTMIINSSGEVVWYSPTPVAGGLGVYDVRQLANGDLFLQEQAPLDRFAQMNMLGETVTAWPAADGYPIDGHEGLLTDRGSILYLSNVGEMVSNFPTNATDPNAARGTVLVDDNPIVEISTTDGSLLNAWSPLDIINPTRVTYLTYEFQTAFGVDNEHANAIIEDPRDNSIIVSLRTQHAVFKFLRSTGKLKWILGPHANWGPNFQQYLLTPVGTPFAWNYGQHAPEITPQGTLLLYDNGNNRACPFDPPVPDESNYSRAVEYRIDESSMQVTQVWDSAQIVGDRIYTGAVGDADYLPRTGNILITHGLISYVNGAHPSRYAAPASMVRIREVTHKAVPEVVFEISFFDSNNTNSTYRGYLCYRSDRIADLYAHPALPVADLRVSTPSAGGARLDFSADPVRTYTVEASSDLAHWVQLGAALPGGAGGADTFTFTDAAAAGLSGRYYRVITQ